MRVWRPDSRTVFQLDRIPIGDVPKVLWHASLILNDHVVQDDARCNMSLFLIEPLASNTRNNGKALLKHIESFLNILSFGLLTHCIVGYLVAFRMLDCLHQMLPMEDR